MQQRASHYFPFKGGSQAQSQIEDAVDEDDAALTHQTFFTIAADRVLDQLIDELLEARQDLHRAQDRLRIQEERHASEGRHGRASRGEVPVVRDIYMVGEQPPPVEE
jgi:outer membrane protein TolC